MKKTLFTIALMAFMLLATSGYNDADNGIRKGDLAPALSLKNSTQSIDLAKLRGKYVLLTFWTSTDAASRIGCNNYTLWTNANPSSNLQHIAVNLDTEEVLFEGIAKREGMDSKVQFNVRGDEASQIKRDFHLTDGYGSMLIDPDGKIIAINPTTSELSSLI